MVGGGRDVLADDADICCREEIEKQRAAKAYAKRHEEGRTEEAQRDLARLAIIRQKREEAAKKREEATKKREESAKGNINGCGLRRFWS